MVYSNLFWTYEVSRKDDQNLSSYSRDVGDWDLDSKKEHGMMQAEDKARIDRQADLKDFCARRDAERAYYEDDLRDDYYEW